MEDRKENLIKNIDELEKSMVYLKNNFITDLVMFMLNGERKIKNMTENEKLECAIHCMKVQADIELCEDCKAYSMDSSTCEDIAREGYKALEYVQEYRKLGTVEEFRKMASIINKSDTDELSKIIDDWIKYQKLGTVEEVKKAVEKTKAKKCIKDTYPDHTHYKCPTCGKIQKTEYDCGTFGCILNNCSNCGQRLEV